MKTLLTPILGTSILLAMCAVADDARIEKYTSELRSVRVPELPRETARLVAGENEAMRAAAAADAVTAAVTLYGPSAAFVVGAVAKSSPSTAASAAGTAAKLQPTMLGEISRAAVTAAPLEIGAIVTAMCQAQPVSFYVIGLSAADVAPKKSDQVLLAITAALPALKPLVARSQAEFAAAKRTASLALLLKHVENMLSTVSRDAKESSETLLTKETETSMATRVASLAMGPPPGQGPPFVPGGGPPSETPSGRTIPIPPQSRNYSTP